MALRRSTLKLIDRTTRSRIPDGTDPATLRPLRGRVLIRVLEEKWERPSGLTIPENVRPSSCQARVLRMADDVYLEYDLDDGVTVPLAPDDHILFQPWHEANEETWQFDGSEHLIIPAENILGVVEV